MREGRPELIGKFGPQARRWKGDKASYTAKHMWIAKHYGKACYCENDRSHTSKRFEWANISGEYKRDRSDYKQLCVSCHRRLDKGNYCRNGHEYTKENTYIRKQGWRACRTCLRKAHRKYAEKTNQVPR